MSYQFSRSYHTLRDTGFRKQHSWLSPCPDPCFNSGERCEAFQAVDDFIEHCDTTIPMLVVWLLSFFIKVDEILAEKGDKSVSIECTLIASSWVGVDAPFTQELAVTDLGAAQNGNISVAHSATFEQREMARDAKLCVTGQSDGKLIISADGEMPDIDIPVVITLLG